MQTSNAQRSWSAFSAEDREARRALGGLTLKMYDEDEVPLDHALRHWSYREFPRDLGHISKIYNGEVIGSYLEAGGNPDATLYGGTYGAAHWRERSRHSHHADQSCEHVWSAWTL